MSRQDYLPGFAHLASDRNWERFLPEKCIATLQKYESPDEVMACLKFLSDRSALKNLKTDEVKIFEWAISIPTFKNMSSLNWGGKARKNDKENLSAKEKASFVIDNLNYSSGFVWSQSWTVWREIKKRDFRLKENKKALEGIKLSVFHYLSAALLNFDVEVKNHEDVSKFLTENNKNMAATWRSAGLPWLWDKPVVGVNSKTSLNLVDYQKTWPLNHELVASFVFFNHSAIGNEKENRKSNLLNAAGYLSCLFLNEFLNQKDKTTHNFQALEVLQTLCDLEEKNYGTSKEFSKDVMIEFWHTIMRKIITRPFENLSEGLDMFKVTGEWLVQWQTRYNQIGGDETSLQKNYIKAYEISLGKGDAFQDIEMHGAVWDTMDNDVLYYAQTLGSLNDMQTEIHQKLMGFQKSKNLDGYQSSDYSLGQNMHMQWMRWLLNDEKKVNWCSGDCQQLTEGLEREKRYEMTDDHIGHWAYYFKIKFGLSENTNNTLNADHVVWSTLIEKLIKNGSPFVDALVYEFDHQGNNVLSGAVKTHLLKKQRSESEFGGQRIAPATKRKFSI